MKLTCSLLLTLLLPTGCSPSPAVLAALEVRKQAEDDIVIALVLRDFVSRSSEYSAKSATDDDRIVLNAVTRGDSPSRLVRSDLTYKKWSVPDVLISDLDHRNTRQVSLKGKHFGDRVIIEDFSQYQRASEMEMPTQLSKKHPHAKALVALFLPGYDQSLSRAIVRIDFRPSVHGAAATYLLIKKDSRWTIQRQSLGYY